LGLCGLWEGLQHREGLETAVTEGGENLSAGERQLLNIARALLSRRRVVLVDEATASIDSQSDAAIQRVLRTHFAESTVLTIAHRLDSVAHCDRILGLEAGEVKEFDTPANLLKRKDSLYQQLCE
jgi:ABC-type multidrug transport system fused ATPase/permease subunit